MKDLVTWPNDLLFDRLVVIAADISPIDVLSHLPILCEEKNVPYIYVKSRAEVGEACKTKRPTSCVLIQQPGKDAAKVKKSFDRCCELVKAKNPYVDWSEVYFANRLARSYRSIINLIKRLENSTCKLSNYSLLSYRFF